MTRTRSLLAAVALAAVALLSGVTAAPAFAHTSLIGAEPADESTVEALPEVISLAFSDEIQEPAYVVVTDPEGNELQRGAAVIEGIYVRQKVDATQATGTHTIAYRVVSSDGHPVQGTVTTQVGTESSAAGETGSTPDDSEADADTDTDTPAYLPITIGLLVVLVGLGVGVVIVVVKRRRQ